MHGWNGSVRDHAKTVGCMLSIVFMALSIIPSEAVAQSKACDIPEPYSSLCNYDVPQALQQISDTKGYQSKDALFVFFNNPGIRRYFRATRSRFPLQDLLGMALSGNSDAMLLLSTVDENPAWTEYWLNKSAAAGNTVAILMVVNRLELNRRDRRNLINEMTLEGDLRSASQEEQPFSRDISLMRLAGSNGYPNLFEQAQLGNRFAADKLLVGVLRQWKYAEGVFSENGFEIISAEISSPELSKYIGWCFAGVASAFGGDISGFCGNVSMRNAAAKEWLQKAATEEASFQNKSFPKQGYRFSAREIYLDYVESLLFFLREELKAGNAVNFRFWAQELSSRNPELILYVTDPRNPLINNTISDFINALSEASQRSDNERVSLGKMMELANGYFRYSEGNTIVISEISELPNQIGSTTKNFAEQVSNRINRDFNVCTGVIFSRGRPEIKYCAVIDVIKKFERERESSRANDLNGFLDMSTRMAEDRREMYMMYQTHFLSEFRAETDPARKGFEIFILEYYKLLRERKASYVGRTQEISQDFWHVMTNWPDSEDKKRVLGEIVAQHDRNIDPTRQNPCFIQNDVFLERTRTWTTMQNYGLYGLYALTEDVNDEYFLLEYAACNNFPFKINQGSRLERLLSHANSTGSIYTLVANGQIKLNDQLFSYYLPLTQYPLLPEVDVKAAADEGQPTFLFYMDLLRHVHSEYGLRYQ